MRFIPVKGDQYINPHRILRVGPEVKPHKDSWGSNAAYGIAISMQNGHTYWFDGSMDELQEELRSV